MWPTFEFMFFAKANEIGLAGDPISNLNFQEASSGLDVTQIRIE